MADRPQMPPPPDGCVYGPWWNEMAGQWFILDSYSELQEWNGEHWDDRDSKWIVEEELLRLAKELAQKDSRIKELENALEDLALCARSLDITEQTHDPSDCELLGELLATAESLLKGGHDA